MYNKLFLKMTKLCTFMLHKCKKKSKSKFRLIFGQFLISSWSKKGHEPSRAENPSARAMARASLARTHHYSLCLKLWKLEYKTFELGVYTSSKLIFMIASFFLPFRNLGLCQHENGKVFLSAKLRISQIGGFLNDW